MSEIFKTTAKVLSIRALNESIHEVILKPNQYIPYQAGQYLQILSPSHEGLFYSIANAPQTDTYELHIRKLQCVDLKNILEQPQLNLQLPFGVCTLKQIDLTRPLLCIAGGTGFAPVRAILMELLATNPSFKVTVIWAVKNSKDFYPEKLRYIPHIANSLEIKDILAYYPKALLRQAEIILAGPFNMVYTLRDELLKLGVAAEHLHSDAFSFESKEK